MSELGKEIIISRIRGMTKEEKEIALKAMPTYLLLAEISRREDLTETVLKNIYNILNNVKEESDLTELQRIVSELKQQLGETHGA